MKGFKLDGNGDVFISNSDKIPSQPIEYYGGTTQEADWSQAEGETSQAVTQQGENLLDLERLEGTLGGLGWVEITYLENGYHLEFSPNHSNRYAWQKNINPIRVEPNTDYTIVVEFKSLTNSDEGILGLCENYQGSETVLYHVSVICDSNGRYFKQFNSGEFEMLYLIMSVRNYSVENQTIQEYTNIQLLKGTYTEETLPDYEPFVPDSPSPEYPSEMTSIIPAGSYQIPTENGIYEVTLEEPLRGLGEYRDKLCFDSVSGKGYLERAIGVKTDLRVTTLYHNIDRNEKCVVLNLYTVTGRMSGDTPYLCSHFKQNNQIFDTTNYIEGIWLHTNPNISYSGYAYVKLRKERLDLTDNTTVISSANTFLATLPTELLYVLRTPLKTSLTFTKVESSTAPVLPWTAYGDNLFDLESLEGKLSVVSGAKLTYLENGYRIENQTDTVAVQRYAMQTNANPIQLEPNTDYTLIFDFKVLEGENWGRLALCRNYFGAGNVNFLVYTVCNVSRRYSVVFNSGETTAAYLYFSLNNTETAVPIKKEYTNITLTKGLGVSPPESLTPSPDYPYVTFKGTKHIQTETGYGAELNGLPEAKDILVIDKKYHNGQVVRNLAFIENYNGESIEGEYMSSTGSLTNGAKVLYQLPTPTVEEIPYKEAGVECKIQMIDGDELVQQNVKMVLNTNKGEWFFNEELGIEFSNILGKNINEEVIRNEIQQGLLQVDSSFILTSFEMSFESSARKLKITFTAQNDSGDELSGVTEYA